MGFIVDHRFRYVSPDLVWDLAQESHLPRADQSGVRIFISYADKRELQRDQQSGKIHVGLEMYGDDLVVTTDDLDRYIESMSLRFLREHPSSRVSENNGYPAANPMTLTTISEIFCVRKTSHIDNLRWWKHQAKSAKRNGLACARTHKSTGSGESLFDPTKVREWLATKGYFYLEQAQGGESQSDHQPPVSIEPNHPDSWLGIVDRDKLVRRSAT